MTGSTPSFFSPPLRWETIHLQPRSFFFFLLIFQSLVKVRLNVLSFPKCSLCIISPSTPHLKSGAPIVLLPFPNFPFFYFFLSSFSVSPSITFVFFFSPRRCLPAELLVYETFFPDSRSFRKNLFAFPIPPFAYAGGPWATLIFPFFVSSLPQSSSGASYLDFFFCSFFLTPSPKPLP